MRTQTFILVVAITAMTATVAFAGSDILGRTVAETGVLEHASGTLQYNNGEWFLENSIGTYELHLGPLGHDTLPFTNGAEATTYGFVLKEHIAPVSVATGNETYEFWREERYPGWAGEGERQNVASDRPEDAPVARGKAVDDNEMNRRSNSGFSRENTERGFQNQDLRPGRGR